MFLDPQAQGRGHDAPRSGDRFRGGPWLSCCDGWSGLLWDRNRHWDWGQDRDRRLGRRLGRRFFDRGNGDDNGRRWLDWNGTVGGFFDQRRRLWFRSDLDHFLHGYDHDRLHRLDEARRWQRRRGRLGRLDRFFRLAFADDGFGEEVAAWQRDVALAGEPIDELSRDDFFDRARRALHVDSMIALEQRGDFLTGGPQQFREPVNPDCCQAIASRSAGPSVNPPIGDP